MTRLHLVINFVILMTFHLDQPILSILAYKGLTNLSDKGNLSGKFVLDTFNTQLAFCRKYYIYMDYRSTKMDAETVVRTKYFIITLYETLNYEILWSYL